MAGWKPAAVFVTVGAAPIARYWFQNPERAMQDGGLPMVFTDGASPAVADLRFLRGLRVHVCMGDGARSAYWPWWDAIQAVEPAAMYGVEPDGEVVTWPN